MWRLQAQQKRSPPRRRCSPSFSKRPRPTPDDDTNRSPSDTSGGRYVQNDATHPRRRGREKRSNPEEEKHNNVTPTGSRLRTGKKRSDLEQKQNENKGLKRSRSLFGMFGEKRSAAMRSFRIKLPHELKNHIIYKDIPYYILEDYVHSLISLDWTWLLSLIIGVIVVMVLFISVLLFIASEEKNFFDSYNLTIQTWCTIGYGELAPENDGEELIAVFTTFASFAFTAVCTGLAFVKFSLPYASITWADRACIQMYEKRPSLMIRAAMISADEQLVDCNYQVFILAPRTSSEGHWLLQSKELELENSQPLSMGPNFTLIHKIKENSPLWAVANQQQKEDLDFLIVVRLIAYSMNFQSDVSTTKYYHASDLMVGHRFADAVEIGRESQTVRVSVDLKRLGNTIPIIGEPADILYHAKRFRALDGLPSPHMPTFRPPHESASEITLGPPGIRVRASSGPLFPRDEKMGEDNSESSSIKNPEPAAVTDNAKKTIEPGGANQPADEKLELEPSSTMRQRRNDPLIIPKKSVLQRQGSFREYKSPDPKWYEFFRGIYWSESRETIETILTEIHGRSWWFKIQPEFWFTALTQGRWWATIFVLFLIYWTAIVFFAALMFAYPGSISQVSSREEPDTFLTAIWWSHHTFSSVGYGTLTPGNDYGNFVVTLEGILGMVLLSILAGVFWAKFSGIGARILWCDYAVVTNFDGKPHLMIRTASLWKGHLMMTARMRVSCLLKKEDEIPGPISARQVPVVLEREWNPVFALTGTFMHKIDESSPLLSLLPANFRRANGLQIPKQYRGWKVLKVICLMEAFDGLFQQTVVSQRSYIPGFCSDELEPGAILSGFKFNDVIYQCPDTKRVVIDYSKFHEVTRDVKCKIHDYDASMPAIGVVPEEAADMKVRGSYKTTGLYVTDRVRHKRDKTQELLYELESLDPGSPGTVKRVQSALGHHQDPQKPKTFTFRSHPKHRAEATVARKKNVGNIQMRSDAIVTVLDVSTNLDPSPAKQRIRH
mmetsp:Transcript_25370/g.61103  ORF Transcript_25370/g.61103 Transcript_25370/m.61103 type:complete len:1005 (-) Transcript_25370:53-3067(-)